MCINIEDFHHLNWCWYFVCNVLGCMYGSHTKQLYLHISQHGRSTRFFPREGLCDWQEALRLSHVTLIRVMIMLITAGHSV